MGGNVLWRYESNFEFFAIKGSVSVARNPGKRRNDEYVVTTVKPSDGSIMVWEYFWEKKDRNLIKEKES